MRLALAALCLVIGTMMATAQTRSDEKKPGDPPGQSGHSVQNDNKGQSQSQDSTGPLTTGSGGAPASDPQGGTPPDMQVKEGNPDDEIKAVRSPAGR
ncbi:MAG: hypothetical protein JWP51_2228 [Bradyrhizobium sp.]|jgi:hypothetical protein|nr:hypothetical protein [Bradyrhizobium sp.]